MREPIAYAEHAEDVLAAATALAEAGEPLALVASVAIQGGTAREIGSLAVVDARGRMTGYLSNGCIDRDIQLQGHAAIEKGAARLLLYGKGSPFVDLVLPCGGALSVLVDPAPDTDALHAALETLRRRVPARLRFTLPEEAPPLADGAAELTVEYDPKPELTLAGRGAILRATAGVARSAGFRLRLMSPEADDLAALEGLSPAPPTHLVSPREPPELALDEHSALMTLFHDHDWEPPLLAAALSSPARFVGSLGSDRAHRRRCEALAAMGVAQADIARVRGPLGLVPALRSASLIAVSAVAELSTVFGSAQRTVRNL